MMLSLATEYYQIMLSQGILIDVCLGLLYIPSVALMPLYFKTKRNLALGLATSGGSFGGIIYPIIFRRNLSSHGFGWANRVIGFISLATLATAAALIRPIGPKSARQLLDSSATDPPYITFMISAFFLFAGVLVPYFLCSDFAFVSLGSSSDISYLLAVLKTAQLFGLILPMLVTDWIGPEIILFAAEISAGILGFCWIAVRYSAGYIVWLLVFGFFSGMIVTLPAVVLPCICPSMAVIGTRMGMLYAVAGTGFLISTPVALALNDRMGGFVGAQVWIGTCCFVAVGFFAVTGREANARRRLYESSGRYRGLWGRKKGVDRV